MISNKALELFDLNDNKEETMSNITDSQLSRISAEEEKVNALMDLMGSSDVFGISAHNKRSNIPGTVDQLVSIMSKDVATDDICNYLLKTGAVQWFWISQNLDVKRNPLTFVRH